MDFFSSTLFPHNVCRVAPVLREFLSRFNRAGVASSGTSEDCVPEEFGEWVKVDSFANLFGSPSRQLWLGWSKVAGSGLGGHFLRHPGVSTQEAVL
jgi:hypothetical protein